MSSLAALLDDAEKDIQKVGWRKTGPPTKDTRVTYDLAETLKLERRYTKEAVEPVDKVENEFL
eukprot:CAMPEP_0198218010 /NCGR_PEP_ID=MMETSP1445-20131203/66910_1 /TAXON_ID=36898 /ORGANISM="Pyramimonas sp., Strain CCMP2087" /LENGTH=62 /DNA_ID=CAMNT_0043894889 /DNA_START=245 /DNA_END=430 /DNA_ORIENTATION=-